MWPGVNRGRSFKRKLTKQIIGAKQYQNLKGKKIKEREAKVSQKWKQQTEEKMRSENVNVFQQRYSVRKMKC